MAKSLSQQDVRQYALVGAQARLDALRAEMQSLLGAFPELARKREPAPPAPPRPRPNRKPGVADVVAQCRPRSVSKCRSG